MFIPRWWEPADNTETTWVLRDGPALAEAAPGSWSAVIDTDRDIALQADSLNADDARPGARVHGTPGVTALSPGYLTIYFRYSAVAPGCTVLFSDAGTGYECALLARTLGDTSVTALASRDVARRIGPLLDRLGLAPALRPEITATFDRLIGTTPAEAVPAGALAALAPGGRLVVRMTDDSVIAAEKSADGTAPGYLCLWDPPEEVPFGLRLDGLDPDPLPVTVHPDGTFTLRRAPLPAGSFAASAPLTPAAGPARPQPPSACRTGLRSSPRPRCSPPRRPSTRRPDTPPRCDPSRGPWRKNGHRRQAGITSRPAPGPPIGSGPISFIQITARRSFVWTSACSYSPGLVGPSDCLIALS